MEKYIKFKMYTNKGYNKSLTINTLENRELHRIDYRKLQ